MRGPITRSILGPLVVLSLVGAGLAAAQVASRNVNMVAGTDWPGGDPFLQRQNEPSVAVSTRNPMHLLAGANDYRTVDLPGTPDDKMTGDAWLGAFTSSDGGATWRSTLVPGYPQEAGSTSPLHGFDAGADSVVRAGPHGLFYYSGIVFDRTNPVLEARRRAQGLPARRAGVDGSTSAVFVARYIDNNNKENGEPIAYLGATLAARNDDPNVFLDKPWLAVDMPRRGAGSCTIAQRLEDRTVTQTIPVGNVYLAYSEFTGSQQAGTSQGRLMFTRSTDCGATWSTPLLVSGTHHINQGATIALDPRTGVVFVVWRRFKWPLASSTPSESDAILIARSLDRGQTFTTPEVVAEIDPFDQGTGYSQFRTNSYPTAGVDRFGRVLVAYSSRGVQQPDGDARILLTWARYPSRLRVLFSLDEDDGTETARTGDSRPRWTAPTAVDRDVTRRGHQIMPSMLVTGLRVQIAWVDLQEDHTWGVYTREEATGRWLEERVASNERQTTPAQVFTPRISDADPQTRRHSADVWVAQADPGDRLTFSVGRASDYRAGTRADVPGVIQQLQFNPPNLPLFKQGGAAFWGDYIDLGGQPLEQKQPRRWRHALQPPAAHVVFTDNRDVRAPLDGNWSLYTPPASPALKPVSTFDPTQATCNCDPAHPERAGMRNQNVYAARVTQGLHVAAPGNAKPLGRIQRAFVVVAANDTFVAKTFRMSIASQPSGGSASFRQFATLTQLDLTIGPRSSVSRTVYVRSTDSRASVRVDVRETSNGAVVPLLLGGLQGSTILNPDLMNPDLMNPDLMNPDMTSADVMNAEVYTPDLMNPDLMNPDLMNPDLMNPDLMNPDLMNPDLMNPDLMNPDLMNPGEVNVSLLNPDLMNPDLMNPDLMNGAFSDTVWTLTNNGNTTAAYDVRLVLRTPVPEGFSTQLLLYKTYLTPVARDCKLTQETQNVLVASIPSPRFDAPSAPLVSDPADGSLQHATLWLAPGETGKVALRVLDPDQTDNVTFNPMVAVTTAVAPQAVDTESAAAGETTPDVVKSSSLGFLGRPSDTPIGGYVDPPVEVLVRDEAGATVMGAAVVLSLVSNPGGATLHGAAATSGEDGVARFDQLWLDRLGTGYRLRATAGTLVSDGGGSFDVVPLVVTSANDAGPGSLRAALENANRNVGYADSITFGIGAGPVVISPSSALPAVTDPVTIDGTTQGGYAGTPLVRLDGASAGTGVHGLSVQASATTIRGLAITRFAGAGIRLDGASGSVVEDSYTGTDGVADLGNGGDGVVIMSGSANEVRRCVISGNDANGIVLSQTSGNRVRGSLIGTNAAGEAAVGNQYAGVYVHTNASANVIGGPDAADMNVISGNGTGLDLVSGAHHNFIQGNRIGTNKAGTAAVGNTGSHGIGVYHDDNEVRGNLISGNTATGLRLDIGHRTLVEGNSIGTDVTGTAAVPNGIGITFANFGSAEHTIRGNLVSGNTGDGIQLLNADHFTIAGNKVGTTAAGTAALPNGSRGIAIYGCVGTTIGGSGPGAGNLVSGNLVTGLALEPLTTAVHYGLVDCVVEGNVVGTDLSGSSRLANGGSGITITAGSAPDAPMSGIVIRGNLLSGNAGDGLVVTQGVHHLTASGNTIGTDLGGALAIPNARHGIYVADGVHDIEIGSGNLISGNAGFGVFLVSPDVPTQNNVVSGNLIGTNRAGTLSVGNLIGVALGGVGIRSNRVAGNVASGNALYGVALTGDTHDNTVVGNKIGTNAAGTGALPNLQDGLYVGGTSDLIGGSGAGEGNLISGNGGAGVFIQGGSGNRVRGNWIGLDASGLSALGNAVAGVSIASLSTVSNIIGGPNPGDGNVISGNPLGVSVPGAGAQIIEGNRVGTNPAGDAAIGNTGDGIFFGSAEGVVIRANLVSGNGGCGIVGSGNSAQITGNNVGTNLAGTSALGNTSSGICVGNGSGFSIRDNLVSGNLANGVWAAQATATTIAANRIGTDAAGTSAVPNQLDGVYVTGSGVSLIGGPAAADGNTIAFNLGKGIGYGGWFGGSAFGSNRIFSNGGLGIDLGDSGVTPNDTGDGDTGPNELQNFPVLTSAIASGGSTTVSGTLNTFPGTFTIQFFSSSACDPSGYGEGELLEGSTLVATDAEGYSSYSVVLPRDLSGRGVTATATASTIAVGARTSEFSACVPVLP